jgi:hypothetical protein
MPYSATAAETGHGAALERLRQLRDVADRAGRARGIRRPARRKLPLERLDLEAVDADDRVAVVHEVVREREPGRPHAHDEDALPGCAKRQRAAQVQRIPAREERVDLEAPGQPEDVLQRARLRLRDVRPGPGRW